MIAYPESEIVLEADIEDDDGPSLLYVVAGLPTEPPPADVCHWPGQWELRATHHSEAARKPTFWQNLFQPVILGSWLDLRQECSAAVD